MQLLVLYSYSWTRRMRVQRCVALPLAFHFGVHVNRLTVNCSHCFSLMCQGLGQSHAYFYCDMPTFFGKIDVKTTYRWPSLLNCSFEFVGQVKHSFSALAHRVDDRVIL